MGTVAIRTAILAVAVTLALGACSSEPATVDSSGPASSSRPAPTGTPTTALVDATTTPTTSTTAPSAPDQYTTEAADAARELLTAWRAGDRDRAGAVAPGDVVTALFPLDPEGYELYGCDTGEFATSTCNFRNRARASNITVTMNRHPEGWQVSTVYVSGG